MGLPNNRSGDRGGLSGALSPHLGASDYTEIRVGGLPDPTPSTSAPTDTRMGHAGPAAPPPPPPAQQEPMPQPGPTVEGAPRPGKMCPPPFTHRPAARLQGALVYIYHLHKLPAWWGRTL